MTTTLSTMQLKYLRHGVNRQFEPTGRGWRSCDSLVKQGLMSHNGAARLSGERFTTTTAGIEALAQYQPHTCPNCGQPRTGPGECQNPECGNRSACIPEWVVCDSSGRVHGAVYGASHNEALESAKQMPIFDNLKAFTVLPSIVED